MSTHHNFGAAYHTVQAAATFGSHEEEIGMRRCLLGGMLLALTVCPPSALGQFGAGGAGGIIIDARGVIGPGTVARVPGTRKVNPNANDAISHLRRVSLKGIEAAAKRSDDQPPRDEVEYLAGLTSIEYVLASADGKDIWLCGHAEPWTHTSQGRVVGANSGRPVVRLEDLVTALRCVVRGTASAECSIDPTSEGLAALARYNLPPPSSKAMAQRTQKQVARQLGLQRITTRGVPADSRFALVMIEADYRMKRIALGQEPARGITTHLDTLVDLTARRVTRPNMARWWFTMDYPPLEKSPDGLAFCIHGPAFRLLNEEVLVDSDGRRHSTGRSNPDWDRFADSFNQNRELLEKRTPVFAELHHLFDLMVVAALIDRQGWADRLDESFWFDEPGGYQLSQTEPPTQAEPVVQFRLVSAPRDGGREMQLTIAYGGISMAPTAILDQPSVIASADSELTELLGQIAANDSIDAVAPDEAAVESEATSIPSTTWWRDVTPQ